jgi:hypothetical protein
MKVCQMALHSLRITTSGRNAYSTTGAVVLASSVTPVLDAARALIAKGHSPQDKLRAEFAEGNILPVTLASIVKLRVHPRAAWGVHRDAEWAAAGR